MQNYVCQKMTLTLTKNETTDPGKKIDAPSACQTRGYIWEDGELIWNTILSEKSANPQYLSITILSENWKNPIFGLMSPRIPCPPWNFYGLIAQKRRNSL